MKFKLQVKDTRVTNYGHFSNENGRKGFYSDIEFENRTITYRMSIIKWFDDENGYEGGSFYMWDGYEDEETGEFEEYWVPVELSEEVHSLYFNLIMETNVTYVLEGIEKSLTTTKVLTNKEEI